MMMMMMIAQFINNIKAQHITYQQVIIQIQFVIL